MIECLMVIGIAFIIMIIIFIYCSMVIASRSDRRSYGDNKDIRLYKKRSKKK